MPRLRRLIQRLRADDAGSAPIDTVLVFPAFALLSLMVVQGCMWFYAREIAVAAATEGARAGAGYNSGPAAGVDRANFFIANTHNTLLLSPQITAAGSTANTVQITVTGSVPSLLFGLANPPIVVVVNEPVERLTSGNNP